MLLHTFYDGLEIHRREKIIYAKFLTPHRVISTCRFNGGLKEDLNFLYNHQSCEPKGHHLAIHANTRNNPEGYVQAICDAHDLPHRQCASLGTAANMNFAAIETASFEHLTVIAVCTGGVETNAGRVGDIAHYAEKDGRFYNIDSNESKEKTGTINTLLFINQPLIKGAMVRAIVTATEAKTAALQELCVNSRYSSNLATGTGTDQIGIAAMMTPSPPLTWAGKHTKLGELIGRCVITAIKKTLSLQNGLTPERQRSVKIHLERFGVNKKILIHGISGLLEPDEQMLFTDNFEGVNGDPMVVSAVSALVHLRDKFTWNILPHSCMPEIFSSFGAQISAAVSGKYEHIPRYRDILSHLEKGSDDKTMLQLIYNAIAIGFKEKWT